MRLSTGCAHAWSTSSAATCEQTLLEAHLGTNLPIQEPGRAFWLLEVVIQVVIAETYRNDVSTAETGGQAGRHLNSIKACGHAAW